MDHDRLFKELLSTFFTDFLRLFVPSLAEGLEEASLVPLDKEVFTDVTAGERHEVDLLVRARLQGSDAFFLIHVENQSKVQAEFPKRMFRYFARLYERHDLPIYPIALFSFERPRREEPHAHDMAIAGLQVLRFRFRTVQLNRLSWRDFRETPNPVASALMARMAMSPDERGRVKWECYRMLATLRLDPAKSRMIGGFVDAYLRLDEAQNRLFRDEVERAAPQERKAVMELSTPWHREGRQEGLQEGRQAEAARLVVRLLAKRLGSLSPERIAVIEKLPLDTLENLAEAIFEINDDADLAPWLS